MSISYHLDELQVAISGNSNSKSTLKLIREIPKQMGKTYFISTPPILIFPDFFACLAGAFLAAVFFTGLDAALPLLLAGLAAGFAFDGFLAVGAGFLAAGFLAAGLATFFAGFLVATRRILSFLETQKAACYSLVLGKRQHYPHSHGRANA